MKIAFLGDISLNDNYIRLYKENVNPFLAVEPYLSDCNFVVGNLECMAMGGKGVNELKKPRLGTTLETLNYLKDIRLNVACLAQNHAYDYLSDGFIKTTNFLEENSIKYFGASLNKSEVDRNLILTNDSLKVALLNYVTNDTHPNLPPNAKLNLNIFELSKCIEDISSVKQKVDHVVVILHWGGRVEGGLFPDYDQPELSRILIDSGADVIIGHHSHTVQPFEIYKGKYIFYSLGNFCFSDYTFENKFNPMSKRRRISFVVGLEFKKGDYIFVPTYFENKLTHFIKLPSYNLKHRFRNFLFQIMRRSRLLWHMYFFHFNYILPVVLFYQRQDISFNQKNARLLKSIKSKF